MPFLYATRVARPGPTRFSCAGRKARVGFCERQLTGEQVGVFIYCGALTEGMLAHVQPATTRVVRRSLYEYRTVLNLSLINDFAKVSSLRRKTYDFCHPSLRCVPSPSTDRPRRPRTHRRGECRRSGTRVGSWLVQRHRRCVRPVLFFTLALYAINVSIKRARILARNYY